MNIFQLFIDSLPSLLSGLSVTIELAVISLILAVILGIILGIFSISTSKILKGIATIYIYVIRGTPLMLQALFLYFGIGQALDIQFDPIVAGIITLTANASAYMAEIFRGGIQAVDKGQMEAARCLGLSYSKAMRKVILPQAIKIMIPSILNQFIVTLKDTSILTVISVRELTESGKIIIARNYMAFEMYAILACMYFIIITALSLISNHIERRSSYGNKR
ncbi:amino acid ABC transporter permease [Clostridium saccharoperbutylacetonicum]|jgi:polar amino acid transport system permease protein/polar amino acid transport system substrate-binding protein|uniref:Amine acid ABC transporter, permease protein, 3-TM region, His/Glu/Gln/Arg/opine family n=1 Tax=Clostridium saccharoperbutylacetonicum N1-4(HMT) TaxID=931276 RepID=M1LXF2_9CLOT|nr:amino acid ABC transporter permease [Clostridium saccharoperbutylacetonicum]AGF57940.1 amine acid ABC transporter, permease protein, 3-TM region, His/Glu/Gln/Arg/opine family [Clostridium saccharoperbutylacetonicum N1-4(HMT)]NRT61287.1 polar amino acid transport system permease protein/polar amino acid transport system substrate-binding protein [Clostridium saccharoperbutylacetonicum]NSB24604.1 polar amino acid transport system permease protein/polar amino acid transport system substrate-bind